MNIMNLLIVLAFMGLLGMIIALAMCDKALFLTNALFVSVIVMHDAMRQYKTGKK